MMGHKDIVDELKSVYFAQVTNILELSSRGRFQNSYTEMIYSEMMANIVVVRIISTILWSVFCHTQA